jgi:hypothetical protein
MNCTAPIQPFPVNPAPSSSSATGLRKKFLDHQEILASPYVAHLEREAALPLNLDSVVEAVVEPGPEIQWMPSWETFQRRVEALKALDLKRPNYVPEGFPDKIIEPWVWSGEDFEGEDEYVVTFSQEDVLEIENALAHFKVVVHNLDPGAVSKETFPLPNLAERLEDVAQDIHNGIGFTMLRGLEPRRYTAVENVLIYLGVTSYVAPIRGVQDSSGHMLSEIALQNGSQITKIYFVVHIKDLGHTIADSDLRQSPYASNAQVRFQAT